MACGCSIVRYHRAEHTATSREPNQRVIAIPFLRNRMAAGFCETVCLVVQDKREARADSIRLNRLVSIARFVSISSSEIPGFISEKNRSLFSYLKFPSCTPLLFSETRAVAIVDSSANTPSTRELFQYFHYLLLQI